MIDHFGGRDSRDYDDVFTETDDGGHVVPIHDLAQRDREQRTNEPTYALPIGVLQAEGRLGAPRPWPAGADLEQLEPSPRILNRVRNVIDFAVLLVAAIAYVAWSDLADIVRRVRRRLRRRRRVELEPNVLDALRRNARRAKRM